MEAEKKLAELTDAQMSLLEDMFPRHVLEYMAGSCRVGAPFQDDP